MDRLSALKEAIRKKQIELTSAIHVHQVLYVKMRDDISLEGEVKPRLVNIQKEIIDLNAKQKLLIQQLREELELNKISNGDTAFHFDMYKVKPGQLGNKKRMRKQQHVTPKVVLRLKETESRSPSPTSSLCSSISDDCMDFEEVMPSQLPIPLPQPRPRPKLLPDSPSIFNTPSRRDMKPCRARKYKSRADAEIMKDIPVYYDPPPSPEPTEEREIKLRFTRALGMIPKEMLAEFINKKVERKRRSTANNPQFVYNNEWEIPLWKRSRTYLAPHKSNIKMDSAVRKLKVDVQMDDNKVEINRNQQPEANVEIVKSRISSPESSPTLISRLACSVCHSATGVLFSCNDCTANYHANCDGEDESDRPGQCPQCKYDPTEVKIEVEVDETVIEEEEEADKEEENAVKEEEEFAAKCPNVAESYNKLQEYIKKHQPVDRAALKAERENVKFELMSKNQELYNDKEELEEQAAQLSELLMADAQSKKALQAREKEMLTKIDKIRDFVILFQKANKKTEKCRDDGVGRSLNVSSKPSSGSCSQGTETSGMQTTSTTEPNSDSHDDSYKGSNHEELSENSEHSQHVSDSESVSVLSFEDLN